MKIAILPISTGDTNLLCEVIKKMTSALVEKGEEKEAVDADKIWVVSLSAAAVQAVGKNGIEEGGALQIVKDKELQELASQWAQDPKAINQWVQDNGIEHVVIGFPSPLAEELPFKLAAEVRVPCTLVYEYMFKPQDHVFFKNDWIGQLASNEHCHITVPLKGALSDFSGISPERLHVTGHLVVEQVDLARKNWTLY